MSVWTLSGEESRLWGEMCGASGTQRLFLDREKGGLTFVGSAWDHTKVSPEVDQ